jgi:hypothetical protein
MLKQYNLKWLLVGLLISLLNPIFCGIVIGLAYVLDDNLKREGWIVLGFTIIYVVVLRIFVDFIIS